MLNQQLQQLCQQQQPLPAEFRSIETRLGDGFRYLSSPSTKLRSRVRGHDFFSALVNPGPTRSKPFATICGKCAPYLGILRDGRTMPVSYVLESDLMILLSRVVPLSMKSRIWPIHALQSNTTSICIYNETWSAWRSGWQQSRFTWCIGRTSFRPQRKCWVRWVRLMYQVCLQYFAVPCQCCAVLSVGVVTSVSMVIQHVSSTVTLIYDLAQIQDVASSRSETSVVANMSS